MYVVVRVDGNVLPEILDVPSGGSIIINFRDRNAAAEQRVLANSKHSDWHRQAKVQTGGKFSAIAVCVSASCACRTHSAKIKSGNMLARRRWWRMARVIANKYAGIPASVAGANAAKRTAAAAAAQGEREIRRRDVRVCANNNNHIWLQPEHTSRFSSALACMREMRIVQEERTLRMVWTITRTRTHTNTETVESSPAQPASKCAWAFRMHQRYCVSVCFIWTIWISRRSARIAPSYVLYMKRQRVAPAPNNAK